MCIRHCAGTRRRIGCYHDDVIGLGERIGIAAQHLHLCELFFEQSDLCGEKCRMGSFEGRTDVREIHPI